MKIWTIGFTQKTAQEFFGAISAAGVKNVVDVRLNNVSQLAGFAKRKDLEYFLKQICNVDYLHLPELAPTKDMLDGYKKQHKNWKKYEIEFLDLLAKRRIEQTVSQEKLEDGCLLCSEDKPHFCHRRLVAEYLNDHWGHINICHLPHKSTIDEPIPAQLHRLLFTLWRRLKRVRKHF